jgi:hypothetical protein
MQITGIEQQMIRVLRVSYLQEEPMKPADADFGVTVDFTKGESDPVAVFGGIAAMLRGFSSLDEVLIEALDPKLEPIMVLEDVEASTITTWVRNKLRQTDDQLIKDADWKKTVGRYALKAKYRVLEYLDKRADAQEAQRLDTLKHDLERLAQDAEFRAIPLRAPIQLEQLVVPLDQIQDAKSLLSEFDRLIVKSDDHEHEVNLRATKRPSEFLPVPAANRQSTGEMEMTLLVRRPDYLGDALWEFKHGSNPISAHILDAEWLDRFRQGQEIIKPGSALVCRVAYSYAYDEKSKLSSAKHDIVKVIKVINTSAHQTDLL